MRGIHLKDAINNFGFKSGLSFWFNWSFKDPIKMFWWMNISHKPYCSYSGFYCRKDDCKHLHLITKKQIKERWAKNEKELKTIEEGENGLCTYCGEEEGTEIVDNPNMDSLSRWKVCGDCKKVISLQQESMFGHLTNNLETIRKCNEELYKISQRTGKPIMMATIDKDLNVSSVEFTGETHKTKDVNTSRRSDK